MTIEFSRCMGGRQGMPLEYGIAGETLIKGDVVINGTSTDAGKLKKAVAASTGILGVIQSGGASGASVSYIPALPDVVFRVQVPGSLAQTNFFTGYDMTIVSTEYKLDISATSGASLMPIALFSGTLGSANCIADAVFVKRAFA